MASTEQSRRASVASSSELSLVEHTATKKPPAKKEKAIGGVNLKKSIVKKTKPKGTESNGRSPSSLFRYALFSDGATGTNTAGATRSPSPESPTLNGTGPKAGQDTDLVECKHCKKRMTESVLATHTPICPIFVEKKKEKARKKKEAKEAKARELKAKEAAKEKENDGDSVMAETTKGVDGTEENPGSSTKKPPKKSATKNAPDSTKKGKKRKADEAADKEPKKRKLKKDEPPKPKVPKPKGPVNVETQCGVQIANGHCARSLTCKSHSMGAKRAVPGRSLPYDQLLAMYQKRNQAKIQKAALSAMGAPLGDEEDEGKGPVDSDEEKEVVIAAVARWRPQPLEQHTFVDTARKYKYIRMKEMLGNALGARGVGGGGGGGLFGDPPLKVESMIEGIGVANTPAETAAGADTALPPSRKGSLAQQGQGKGNGDNVPAAPARKVSVASVGSSGSAWGA